MGESKWRKQNDPNYGKVAKPYGKVAKENLVIASDFFANKYNMGEAVALDNFKKALALPWRKFCVIIPESFLSEVPEDFEIEGPKFDYRAQGIMEDAYIISCDRSGYQDADCDLALVNDYKAGNGGKQQSNLEVAIDFAKYQASILADDGIWEAPDGFGPLNAMERQIALAEWKKIFSKVEVNGKMVRYTK